VSSLKRIVFRGDQAAYARRGDHFPYVDHAAQAGATGVHVWFWQEPFRALADEFFAYCHQRQIAVHLGIGVGAYGVCDGEDPTDPRVRQKISDHVSNVIDQFPVAGIEFQNGEYDQLQYQGASTQSKTRAHQVVEQLNPIIAHALDRRPDLWIRTELNAERFTDAETLEMDRELDPRCTVEWSRFTGPYRGAYAFRRGLALLEQSERFSWFLKIVYNRDQHWQELAADPSPAEVRKWIEHWRSWVKLLDKGQRTTLTICNVDAGYVDRALPMPAAAVALARHPDTPAQRLLCRFFS
jgi:hypothetical protein